MSRNLKVLGLAFVAAFAMTAVAAAGASASQFKGTGTSFSGEATSSQDFHVDVGTVECTILDAKGDIEEEVSSTATTTSVEYDGCTAFGLEADVDFNGCNYVFDAGSGEGSSSVGSANVVCPEGQQIEIDASGLCLVTVEEQNNLADVGFETVMSEGAEHIALTADVSNIAYSYSGFCGSGSNNNGVYEGNATVTSDGDLTIVE